MQEDLQRTTEDGMAGVRAHAVWSAPREPRVRLTLVPLNSGPNEYARIEGKSPYAQLAAGGFRVTCDHV
jgi:hypothetical protein